MWGCKNPIYYKPCSLLLKCLLLDDLDFNCIVLYHNCPLLLRISLLNIANKSNLPEKQFLKTINVTFTLKDTTISYKSNDLYFLIDCQPWSPNERRIIPDCIKSLLATRSVLGRNHLVIIEHISCLGEHSLKSLRNIVNDSSPYANFVMSTQKQSIIRTIFDSTSLFIHCDYDVKYLVKNIVQSFKPNLIEHLETLYMTHRNDFGLFLATINHEQPHLLISQIERYIASQLQEFLFIDPHDVYNVVHGIVNDLISSFIHLKLIAPYIIKFVNGMAPSKVMQCVKLLTDVEMLMVQSNKIIFAYELCFLELYKLLQNINN